MTRPALEFFNTEEIAWEPYVVQGKVIDSVLMKILSFDKETGASTILIKYPKGFKDTTWYYHNVTEEIFVIKGCSKMYGKEISGEGYYAYRPVGMVHGDMEVLEETIILVILSGPMDYNEPNKKKRG